LVRHPEAQPKDLQLHFVVVSDLQMIRPQLSRD
jgi:hypothetical protein